MKLCWVFGCLRLCNEDIKGGSPWLVRESL